MDIWEKMAAFAWATLMLYAWAAAFYGLFRFCLKYHTYLKPVVVDGALYAMTGMGGSALVFLGDNDVFKYVQPACLVFYIKGIIAVICAGATALITFRNRSYAHHRDAEQRKLGEPLK